MLASQIGCHVSNAPARAKTTLFDIVCKNVLRPLEEQGGGIVECNAAPGVLLARIKCSLLLLILLLLLFIILIFILL